MFGYGIEGFLEDGTDVLQPHLQKHLGPNTLDLPTRGWERPSGTSVSCPSGPPPPLASLPRLFRALRRAAVVSSTSASCWLGSSDIVGVPPPSSCLLTG